MTPPAARPPASGPPAAGQVDLFDPELYLGDPYPVYRWLRRQAPVYWNPLPEGGFWVLSRHEDVCEAGRLAEVFSAASGIIVETAETHMINMMVAGSLIGSDPPRHRDLRRAVADVFKPGAVLKLEPVIRGHVRELLDRVEPGTPFDLVSTVAAPLPTWVIGELLGTPDGERHRLEQLVDAALSYADPDTEFDAVGADAITNALAYFADLAAQRRGCPGNDMVSALCAGTINDRPMDNGEVMQSTFVLLVAGTETVRTVITNGIVALARHPDQERRLRADRSLLPAAIDEIMRWIPPVNYFCRTALGDHEIRGIKIRAGDQVMLHYAAANRDEEVFGPDAEDFDISRTPNPHLAFGFGEHYCLGAQLGRLQVRAFFEEWFDRYPRAELVAEPERLRNTNINGISRLLVRAT